MRSERMSWAVVFAGFFALYLHLAFSGLASFRDSGDFASASVTLGVSHPPGYPLYILLGKLIHGAIPIGNATYRVNVLSALCGAGCAAFAWSILRRRAGRAASWAGALVSGFLPVLVGQSGLSEVYALNAIILAGLLWGGLRVADTSPESRPRFWVVAAFIAGLGLGGHQSLLFGFPALLLLFWRERKTNALRSRFIAALIGAGVLGLSIYLFLPLRGLAGAEYIWGEPASPAGFWNILTRADYGAATLSTRYSTASPAAGLRFWLGAWFWHWGWLGAAAGLLAAACVFHQDNRRSWGGPLLLLWIFTGPVFALIARLETSELSAAILEPALAVPCLAAAIGLGFMIDTFMKRQRLLGLTALLLVAALFVVKLVPGALGRNHRWNLLAPDYGRNLLRTLPPDSVLLMVSDAAVFSVDHARHVLRQRPDLNLLVDADLPWRWRQYRRRYPHLFIDGQADGGVDLVRVQAPRRAVYTEGMQAKFLESLCPRGAAAVVEWPARSAACLDRIEETAQVWEFYVRRVPPPLALLQDFYGRGILKTASSGAFNAGLLLGEGGREEAARALYARALFWNPEHILRWSEAF